MSYMRRYIRDSLSPRFHQRNCRMFCFCRPIIKGICTPCSHKRGFYGCYSMCYCETHPLLWFVSNNEERWRHLISDRETEARSRNILEVTSLSAWRVWCLITLCFLKEQCSQTPARMKKDWMSGFFVCQHHAMTLKWCFQVGHWLEHLPNKWSG